MPLPERRREKGRIVLLKCKYGWETSSFHAILCVCVCAPCFIIYPFECSLYLFPLPLLWIREKQVVCTIWSSESTSLHRRTRDENMPRKYFRIKAKFLLSTINGKQLFCSKNVDVIVWQRVFASEIYKWTKLEFVELRMKLSLISWEERERERE